MVFKFARTAFFLGFIGGVANPVSARPTNTPRPAEDHTSPDTVAVALDYDPRKGELPHVVASGKGYIAEHILALAFANDVKVRRDADLVQILAALDLDSDIPPEAFVAVAEILAYVYSANREARQSLAEWLSKPPEDNPAQQTRTDPQPKTEFPPAEPPAESTVPTDLASLSRRSASSGTDA